MAVSQIETLSRRSSCPHSAPPGNELFAGYLNQQAIFWEYAPEVGDSRPDFGLLLKDGQRLIAEVYEPEEPASLLGDWRNPAKLPGKLFRNNHKGKQIAAAHQAGLPVLGVLASTNPRCDFAIEPFEVAIAMFGLDGPFRSGKFSDISAVGVVRSFNPTAWRLDRHAATSLGSRAASADEGAWAMALLTSEAELLRSGRYDPHARLAYLSVLVNPFADIPLNASVFEGPHDERWDRTGQPSPSWIGKTWEGPGVWQRLAWNSA
jgi:hypothetical protein